MTRNGRNKGGGGLLKCEDLQARAHALTRDCKRPCTWVKENCNGATLKGGNRAQEVTGGNGCGCAASREGNRCAEL